MARIRVLIVDDSAFMRHALTRLLNAAESIEVVGAATNGLDGLRLAAELRPDVVTLDVEMPVMDGLAMLGRLMRESPTRVLMLSSLTTHGASVTLDALDLGAIDFVPKPSGSLSIDIGRVGEELVAKIEAAAAMPEAAFARHLRRASLHLAGLASRPCLPAAEPAPPQRTPVPIRAGDAAPRRATSAAHRLVVVAASTGGPAALHSLVAGLPDRIGAAVVIVQHMPPGFTASLAARLNSAGRLPCTEAQTDDLLVDDAILVAAGGLHLVATSTGHVQLVRLPPVNGVRPAADVTLKALAPVYGERLLAVVLTGMGVDGREGARSVKLHGGTVLVQDEATATIYGMPAAVAGAGLADAILPLPRMGAAVAEWCRQPAAVRPARPGF